MLAAAFLPLAISLVRPQVVVPEIPTVYPRHVQIVTFERTGSDGATGTYAVTERRSAAVATEDPHEDVRQERIDVYRLETGERLRTITREIRVTADDFFPWVMVDAPKRPALNAIGPKGHPSIGDLTGDDFFGESARVSRGLDAVSVHGDDAHAFRFAALMCEGPRFVTTAITGGAPARSHSSGRGDAAPLAAAFVRDDEGARFMGEGFQFAKLVRRADVYRLTVEIIGDHSGSRQVELPKDARFDDQAPIRCCARALGKSVFTLLAQTSHGETPSHMLLVELTDAGASKSHFKGRPTSAAGGAPLDCGRTLGLVHDIDRDGMPNMLTSAPDAEPAVPLIALSGATGAVLATFAGEPGERVGFDLSVSPDGSVVVVLGQRPVEGGEPERTLHVLLVPTRDEPTFRALGG